VNTGWRERGRERVERKGGSESEMEGERASEREREK
jgi:hypothetical protein